MIMILSSIFSNSSSVASLFPALNLESTCLAEKCICIQHYQVVPLPRLQRVQQLRAQKCSTTDLWALLVCLAVCWWTSRRPPSWRWQTCRSSWSRCRWCDPPCPWSPAAPAPSSCLFPGWWRWCSRTPAGGFLKTTGNDTRRLIVYWLPWYSQRPPYLDVLYPVLQEDLDAAPHSTEELVQKRQILNSVLVQQMSQPWRTTTTGRRSELSATLIHRPYLDTEENASWMLSKRDCRLPFCKVAVRCSPSSCFSTVAIRGFLVGKEAQVSGQNVKLGQSCGPILIFIKKYFIWTQISCASTQNMKQAILYNK